MATSSTTPMMSQYLRIKSQYSDALLFYRMGDFYELFFKDAEIASAALNITLTKRGKHKNLDIPMCGVPYHSSENYLLNLIRKGHKVAVCEQLEKPEEAKKRGYKEVVKRDVVRLITPGTLTDEGLLDERKNNFLLSYIENNNNYGVSWADISTGEFYCSELDKDDLLSLINRISPSEILTVGKNEETINYANFTQKIIITPLLEQDFDIALAKKRLGEIYCLKSPNIVDGFSLNEISAMGALLSYLEITQCGKLAFLMTPTREASDLYLKIDAASRRSLEISQTLSGTVRGSLLESVNHTITSGGARLLKTRLNCPSLDVIEIKERQVAITFFIENKFLMDTLRENLKHAPDMQRSLTRLVLSRGSPRDLSIVRNCLRSIKNIMTIFLKPTIPPVLDNIISNLDGFDSLLDFLNSALVENPSISIKDGNFIRSSHDSNLNENRSIKMEVQTLVASLQLRYNKLSEVNSLKIKFNNVLGYFVETPISQTKKMNADELSKIFIHRQTTTNVVRFSTLELSNMAAKILNSQERALALEFEFFEGLVSAVIEYSDKLTSAANALSELDLYSSLGFIAVLSDWIKPNIDESQVFIIKGGRHPVVERSLKNSGLDRFVSNDCDLSTNSNSILLITGPNMAGKSTFLRQNALITILAQIGSYVPADFAHIGIVDQIFSRVGASDDLAKGHSTFMVEMIETATILKQAKKSALIIMDEIGRGTSTYDGLSIAWATLEHIHNFIMCRTLFATHYHELTQLEKNFPNIKNAKVAIREWNDEVIFLHEVKFGKADKSYGIQVAKLAGLPLDITNRAEIILKSLEEGENRETLPSPPDYIMSEQMKTALEFFNMISSLNTDDISPKEAFNILDKMVSKTKSVF